MNSLNSESIFAHKFAALTTAVTILNALLTALHKFTSALPIDVVFLHVDFINAWPPAGALVVLAIHAT